MSLWTEAVTPGYLTGYVRDRMALWPANRFQLRQWLPTRTVSDLEYRYFQGTGGLRRAASLRGWDAEPVISKRRQVQRRTGEMAPISVQKRLGEYERLRMKADSVTGNEVRDQIFSDALDCAEEVETRFELLRGEALVNGQLVLAENGFYQTVPFTRSSVAVQTAPTLWTNTGSADPVTDLTALVQQYVDLNGVKPGAMLTSTKVRGLLTRNATVRSAFGTTAGTPTIVSTTALGQMLEAYDLPAIYTYDVSFENAAGATTRVIPDNVVLLLPPPVAPTAWEDTQLGATFLGETAESQEPEYGLQGNEPGIVVGVHRTDRPISVWTDANAIGMPVLANADLAFKYTVA